MPKCLTLDFIYSRQIANWMYRYDLSWFIRIILHPSPFDIWVISTSEPISSSHPIFYIRSCIDSDFVPHSISPSS